MHHIVYKTTNTINGKFYIGVHSTEDLDDGYLGSGSAIGRAKKKYGKVNFRREILSEWKTRDEARAEEKRIIIPAINGHYNLIEGGIESGFYGNAENRRKSSIRLTENNPTKLDYVRAKLKGTSTGLHVQSGIRARFKLDDPRWNTGEIVHVNKGQITVKDPSGKVFHTTKDDPRWISGELVHFTKGNPRTIAQIIKPEKTCPHCNLVGHGGAMNRWHFDNCKERIL